MKCKFTLKQWHLLRINISYMYNIWISNGTRRCCKQNIVRIQIPYWGYQGAHQNCPFSIKAIKKYRFLYSFSRTTTIIVRNADWIAFFKIPPVILFQNFLPTLAVLHDRCVSHAGSPHELSIPIRQPCACSMVMPTHFAVVRRWKRQRVFFVTEIILCVAQSFSTGFNFYAQFVQWIDTNELTKVSKIHFCSLI